MKRDGEAGRPRDPRVDAAVLVAARELVCEIGYAETGVERIAQRAGVSRTAIYRRWPAKALIIHEAVFPAAERHVHLVSCGELRGDLRGMVAGALALFSRPEVRAAMPGLMADAAVDGRLRAAFRDGLESAARRELTVVLDAARERGELRTDVSAGTVMHLVAGAFLFRMVAWGPEELPALTEELTALLAAALCEPSA
ncbi:TetR/AcrR family transcriptional regulator [Actinocorallia longicatena]|uniref:TetR/AcrR family transcriptional regulator n=1 Tax=Actinocorallia longicatena TaxID=111803 RepID=A0ABP6Q8W0_9ACTN